MVSGADSSETPCVLFLTLRNLQHYVDKHVVVNPVQHQIHFTPHYCVRCNHDRATNAYPLFINGYAAQPPVGDRPEPAAGQPVAGRAAVPRRHRPPVGEGYRSERGTRQLSR